MPRHTRKTWDRIRAAYLAGETDLGKLARRFHVWEVLIAARCAAENWPIERALVASEIHGRTADLAAQVDAWKRERVRAGRLGLIKTNAILESPEPLATRREEAQTLAWLMIAANRALPAPTAIPELPGGDLCDLVVLDADGNARDEAAGRDAARVVEAEPGRPKLLPGKPE